MKRLFILSILAATAIACGNGADKEGAAPAALTVSTESDTLITLTLPATFTGRLPCADCPGQEWTVTLRSDGTFVSRIHYMERGDDATAHDIGRWMRQRGTGHLTLYGARTTERFAVPDAKALRKLDIHGDPIESDLNYTLTRASRMDPLAEPMPLRGMYRYFADAATFVECATEQRYPVAQEGVSAELERAYLSQRTGEEPMMAVVRGYIAERKPMEGPSPVATIVVEQFDRIVRGERCSAPDATLHNTYWKLVEAAHIQVVTPADAREAHLIFDAEGGIKGFGGCNAFFGTARVEGRRIHFGAVGSTQMFCDARMSVEHDFFESLTGAERFAVTGDNLELFAGDNLLARFEAVYFE